MQDIEAAAIKINEIEVEADADRRTPERHNKPDQMNVIDDRSVVNADMPESLWPR